MSEEKKTMDIKQLARIKEMEGHLNYLNEFLPELGNFQTKVKAALPHYQALSNYYSSANWFSDYDAHSQGLVPKDVPCGVLSEDAAYDCLGEIYQFALQQLNIVNKILNTAEPEN
ncbi:DUF4298 domain-containing protein [Amygdalobacter nucleatus]|uniref:DUF4298 domain-containing protein n=1 Tax=Amygdalobacter nucleatus TaxID=3029274 RepID=A0A133YHD7_9FIRM|nr:DUF4298 domain-containing protein [Amygdalobacter nucleatus]KXB42609.1 hypothetical protein HMPREF1872_00298 [Amygdalobacter nucleatus]MDF0486178.1 DUF4298 domain-containing protein [Amygdalobacter nucleatus]